MKKLIFGVLALLMVTCLYAAWTDHRMKANENKWQEFSAETRSLVGHERSEAEQAMSAMGMRLQDTVKTKSEWSKAIDHVSPRPPIRAAEVTLKYTDKSKPSKKCAFLYIDGNDKVSRVHLAIEHL